MNEAQLEKHLRDSDPAPEPSAISSDDLDRLWRRAVELEAGEPRPSRSATFLRPRLLLPVGVLAAVAVIGALLLISSGKGGSGGADPAFADSAVKVAEANSRLLVGEPGWTVVRADQFEPENGEVAFSDGESTLQITWYPADAYESYRRDRAHVGGPDIPVEVLGERGIMIRYGSSTDFATMLPPMGPTFVEIRGDLGSEEAYRRALDSLEQVDVDTWLSAMPASVVQPTDRTETVDAMLDGVPIPPGFDLDEIRTGDTISDRYQLSSRVTAAVACEWLDRYVAAKKAGDEQAAQASVDAMSTSRSWPILQEMNSENGTPTIWDLSDDLARGELNTGVAGTDTLANGKVYEFGPAYATALGCDSEYHRLRTEGSK